MQSSTMLSCFVPSVPFTLPRNSATQPWSKTCFNKCSSLRKSRAHSVSMNQKKETEPIYEDDVMLTSYKYEDEYVKKRKAMDRRFSKAGAMQNSSNYNQVWTRKNQGKTDVWLYIGTAAVGGPILIIIWGLFTGIIPGLQ